jgi:hypothetical protein
MLDTANREGGNKHLKFFNLLMNSDKMASVVIEKMRKHDQNIEKLDESRSRVKNDFVAYLLVAQEKAKGAGIRLYFSNPFSQDYDIPNLTIEGDKVTEHLDIHSDPRIKEVSLPAQEYVMERSESAGIDRTKYGFNVATAKKAVKQIEKILKRKGFIITKEELLDKLSDLNYS